MKRVVCSIIGFVLLFSASAIAEKTNYGSMTIDELIFLREELLSELTAVNSEIANREAEKITQAKEIEGVVTIESLFPDEDFALLIRDTLSKASIKDSVTQEELDSVTSVGTNHTYHIKDLSGVSHLRNLQSLSIIPYESGVITEELLLLPSLRSLRLRYYQGPSLPNWFTQLITLESIDFAISSLTSLPDNIGDMTNLTYIEMTASCVMSIPDSIGQITNLKQLYFAKTWISSVPESLGNCKNLEALDIKNTDVSELPESVRSLNIKYLDISGTNIK